MTRPSLGVLGATSAVGEYLLPLARNHRCIIALSRSSRAASVQAGEAVKWCKPDDGSLESAGRRVEDWVSLAPLWVLEEYFPLFESCNARRVVALGSTSVMTKVDSASPADRELAVSLARAEKRLLLWAQKQGVGCTILRPTMIYGSGKDQNIASIAAFIRRFGFFPLLGDASGLRQPVHAGDVAAACLQALERRGSEPATYDISGADVLSYRQLVDSVFQAMHRPPRTVRVPRSLILALMPLVRLMPQFRGLTAGMADRMNRDMAFDHSAARRDFGFDPRHFSLDARALGEGSTARGQAS